MANDKDRKKLLSLEGEGEKQNQSIDWYSERHGAKNRGVPQAATRHHHSVEEI